MFEHQNFSFKTSISKPNGQIAERSTVNIVIKVDILSFRYKIIK